MPNDVRSAVARGQLMSFDSSLTSICSWRAVTPIEFIVLASLAAWLRNQGIPARTAMISFAPHAQP